MRHGASRPGEREATKERRRFRGPQQGRAPPPGVLGLRPHRPLLPLAVSAAIADHAGKDLTVASCTKAADALRHVILPGPSEPVSFGPNQPYPLGHPHLLVYSSTKLGSLVPAPTKFSG
jgi:hypothetical protein